MNVNGTDFATTIDEKIDMYLEQIRRIEEKNKRKPDDFSSKRASRDFQCRRIRAKLHLITQSAGRTVDDHHHVLAFARSVCATCTQRPDTVL